MMIARCLPLWVSPTSALFCFSLFVTPSARAQSPLPYVWVADASKATPPKGKIRTNLKGHPFTVDEIYLARGSAFNVDPRTHKEIGKDFDAYLLVFKSGKTNTEEKSLAEAFSPEANTDRFEIVVRLQPGKTLANRIILVVPTDRRVGSSSPHAETFLYHGASTPISVMALTKGKSIAEMPDLEDSGAGYTLRLEFGKATHKGISGRIYLCLKDAEKSYLVGSFVAADISDKVIKTRK